MPRIARLPASGGGLKGMAPRLVGRADARPVGLGQTLGHLVGRDELLGLRRRRERRHGGLVHSELGLNGGREARASASGGFKGSGPVDDGTEHQRGGNGQQGRAL